MYSNLKCRILQNLAIIYPEICISCRNGLLRISSESPANIIVLINVSNMLISSKISLTEVSHISEEVQYIQIKYSTHIESTEKNSQRFSNCSLYYICSYYKQVLWKFTQFQLNLHFLSCLKIIFFFK